MLKYWFSIIFIFIVSSTYTQQFNFKSYSLKEGLSRSGIYSITQDSNGFLWIGTEGGGVCKFDGHTFIKYSHLDGLPSENVRVTFEDNRGTIWIGTDNGLAYYDEGKFNKITVKNGLTSNFVRTIAQDNDENIWIGTDFGITIIDSETKHISKNLQVKFTLPNRKVRTIFVDSSIVWIGTDSGLCKFENNNLKVYTTASGLANNLILSLFKSTDGSLWIGTKKGISKLKNDFIKSWTVNDGLINNRVRSINGDLYGNLWFGTKKGISIFNGKTFLNLTVDNGLSNERIRCIYKDCFDNMWLGSYFGGIMRFNYKDFVAFTPKDGLVSNQILSISEDENGHIIVGTYEGASKLIIKNNKLIAVKKITTHNGLLSNQINTVLKDEKGYYWYGSNIGITLLKEGLPPIYINKKDGIKNSVITNIKYYNNSFWVGTENGLSIIQPNNNYSSFKINSLTKEEGLSGEKVTAISKDNKNRIWIGYSDGQVNIFDNNSILTPLIDSNIFEINSICFDELNRVWFGTNEKGIFYCTLPDSITNNKLNFKSINNSNHLSSNNVLSLIYHNQSIWVGNERGVNLISFSSDSTFLIQNLGVERGFLGLQNNLNASFLDSKNNIWFGTVNGLYHLKNNEVNQYNNGKKTITYIKKVTINGKNSNWKNSKHCKGTQGIYNLPKQLELPYNLNNISFEFIGLNYVVPENINYSWRLLGFAEKWTTPTKKNYIDYTNLDPGKYTFELMTTDENGILIDNITSFSFKIKTPYWQSWWFITGGIIIALIFIVEFLGWRTRLLKKKQRELEKIVETRTKKVVEQKEKIESKQKEIERQNSILQEKNKEITDSIQYSKRIQRSILPSKEKVKTILKDYFIFFRPKDIVSGDFFWIEQNPRNKNHVFFAAADCTGHGVPGAMVSMISTTALNSSLLEHHLTVPSLILDKTKEIVIKAFTDHETNTIIKDGMDIALGSLDYSDENNIIFEFSGAQNPAWIIIKKSEPNLFINGKELLPDLETDSHKLYVVPATKQPVGHYEHNKPFNNYVTRVKKGYKIYLFSDGFADQFGGEKGKKYKYKKFKLFLLNIQKHSIDRQKLDTEQEFYNWKKDFEQLDDVCVIGVSV
jgi:ligand-binding sensor domain-containing protein